MISLAWLSWCTAAVAVLVQRMRTDVHEPVVECSRCRGRGFTGGTWVPLLTCARCHGSGYVVR